MEYTKYGMETSFAGSPEEAEAAITESLKQVGFGVLTRIDVADTLKKKIDVDRPPYVILGACNPKLANRATSIEPEIGLLLPCNVVIRIDETGRTRVSVIDPAAMAGMSDNPQLQALVEEAKPLLQQALAALGD